MIGIYNSKTKKKNQLAGCDDAVATAFEFLASKTTFSGVAGLGYAKGIYTTRQEFPVGEILDIGASCVCLSYRSLTRHLNDDLLAEGRPEYFFIMTD